MTCTTPPRGRSAWRVVCVALALAAGAPLSARGQDTGDVRADETCGEEPPAEASTNRPAGAGLFGHVPGRRARVIPAFWRTHPFDQRFPRLAYTRGVGLQASGWLGGVFLNSYDRLSIIAGVERAWAEAHAGGVTLGAGYRAGLLTGYDERLASWADETPVLPFVGLVGWVQVRRVGVDAFYVYRAITLEGSVAF